MTHAWQDIRALRAAPTGYARDDEGREAVFRAALTQAEQLAQAADVAGYAAMPLPLFYALSQAGRAIAAARLPDERDYTSHGIFCRLAEQPDPVVNPPAATPTVMDATITPRATGAFPIVASAVDSPLLAGKTTLWALWAANPDLQNVEMKGAEGDWPRCLNAILPARTEDPQAQTDGGELIVVNLNAPSGTGRHVGDVLARYPVLQGVLPMTEVDGQGPRPAGPDELVTGRAWGNDDPRVQVGKQFDTKFTSFAERWKRIDSMFSVVEPDLRLPAKSRAHLLGIVQPPVAGGPSPTPLMLWWALLLGLSTLARYHPAEWSAAIDPDSSQLAVPLEQVLNIAAERVPARILAALRG